MTPTSTTMQPVTAEQWANTLSSIRCFQTEELFRSGVSIMHSWSPDRTHHYAEVHYCPDGSRHYFLHHSLLMETAT